VIFFTDRNEEPVRVGRHSQASLLSALTLALLLSFPALAFSFSAAVKTVLDGDSIILANGTKVRYFGVNTPEYKQPFAEEAKQFNTQLVRGKEVEVVPAKKKRDGYGRLLAYVSVNDSLINARLLEEGLAYLFTFGPFAHYEEWLALQQRAQAQHKGMWKEGVFGPLKITTLHANAKGNDRKNLNGEYVRVCNVSAKPVELAGFVVKDVAMHEYTFPAGTLEPGYTALLLSGAGDQQRRGGQLIFHWNAGSSIWNNDADTSFLFDPDGRRIDTFQFQKRWRRRSR
jgi:micrococcal nuclease